jgi:hypothetical protein
VDHRGRVRQRSNGGRSTRDDARLRARRRSAAFVADRASMSSSRRAHAALKVASAASAGADIGALLGGSIAQFNCERFALSVMESLSIVRQFACVQDWTRPNNIV